MKVHIHNDREYGDDLMILRHCWKIFLVKLYVGIEYGRSCLASFDSHSIFSILLLFRKVACVILFNVQHYMVGDYYANDMLWPILNANSFSITLPKICY